MATPPMAAVREHSPDLLFLDMQMPGQDGFDVLEALGPERRAEVIFVTAFDEHAVRAFEACALDYLVKPTTRRAALQRSQRARERIAQGRPAPRAASARREQRASPCAMAAISLLLHPTRSIGWKRPAITPSCTWAKQSHGARDHERAGGAVAGEFPAPEPLGDRESAASEGALRQSCRRALRDAA